MKKVELTMKENEKHLTKLLLISGLTNIYAIYQRKFRKLHKFYNKYANGTLELFFKYLVGLTACFAIIP